jgi:hypothetical protein
VIIQHDEVVCLDDVGYRSGSSQALAHGLYSKDAGANARIVLDELPPLILLVVSAGLQEATGKSVTLNGMLFFFVVEGCYITSQ